ncbi:uncharacterized protein LOC124943879 [Impatiens glandulifera]|uniref:uncharacterized protein LOC124943879 n=1 Tax=Impatiens glandulifera TaxID=253017 RepID=UPI001FB0BF19|nr:uncharacterized protein LOC124943879 [Impatiens glandulifera]
MKSHSHGGRSSTGSPNLPSCILATLFLLLIITAAITVFFIFFNPKQPKIAVVSIKFPSFSISNGTVNFTFLQNVSVTNPNRDDFTHYDSSLQLVYSGNPVGIVFIPAGEIGGGRTQHMTAKFDLESYPMAVREVSYYDDENLNGNGNGMVIESRMKMIGRVRVLKIFTHRVESKSVCRVDVDVIKGSVLSVHCS